MKKLTSAVVCLLFLITLFAGCSKKTSESLIERGETIKIGIATFEENENVLASKKGFESGLLENGISKQIEIQYKNAGGDARELEKICDELIKKSDIVVTIGDYASVCAARIREDAQVPIFFIDVENPVTLGLMSNTITPQKNITGVMGNVTPDCVFSFAAQAVGGQLKKVGIIYNTSEINPAYEINELKDYLNSNSIKYFEGVIANVFDAQQAVIKILASKISAQEQEENVKTAFFISSDEVTKKSIPGIASLIKSTGSVAFVSSDVELPNDSFYRIVPSYESLGKKCAGLINDYVNGVDMLAISAVSSDEYNLIQGEIADEVTEDEENGQNDNGQNDNDEEGNKPQAENNQ